MLTLSRSKIEALERLSNGNHIIGALAIDQRGSLKKNDCFTWKHISWR